jgi:hypothetical protein
MNTFSVFLLFDIILYFTVNVSGQLTTELVSIKKARGKRSKEKPGYIKELFQKLSPELLGEDTEESDHGEGESSKYSKRMKGKKGKKGKKAYESGKGKGYALNRGKKKSMKGKKGKKGKKISHDSRYGCWKGKKGNEDCGKGTSTDNI